MASKNVEAIYPLSLSQQGMLLETLSLAQPGIHVEQSIWILHPDLDVELFRRAWQKVVDRHAILRTAFVWSGVNELVQVALQRVEVPVAINDWRELSRERQNEELERYLKTDRSVGFDLRRAPMVRLALMRVDDRTYQFVLTFHHILLDGWSLSLVLAEVLSYYVASTGGQDPPSPSPPLFRDYVRWQRQQDASKAEAYWRERLRGFSCPSALGRTGPASPEPTGDVAYGEEEIRLGSALSEGLTKLARERCVTQNTLFQGAWGLALARYGAEEDIVFGTTVSGRPPSLPGSLSMIGLFINTIPLRVRVRREARFDVWLQDLQQNSASGRAYEHCSSGQIHGWSEVAGNRPLYESVLVFESYPEDVSQLGESPLTIDLLESRAVGARTTYPLTLLVGARPGLWIKAIYQRSRIDGRACAQILEHLRLILESVVESPQRDLGSLLDLIPSSTIPTVVEASPSAPSAPAPFVGPRDSVELRCAAIWEEVFGRRPVGVHDNFFELGGHSLLALNLMNRVEKEFGASLALSTLFERPTVEGVARALRSKRGASKAPSPLVPIRTSGVTPPLFCVPGGAMDVISLHPLSSELGPDIPFYGLQPHGLDGLVNPLRSVQDMAASYVDAIRSVQAQGPYYLGGHSFGAHVAYEMTQTLRAQGHDVALLAVIDAEARRVAGGTSLPGRSSADRLERLFSLLRRFFGRRIDVSEDDLAGLAEDDVVRRLAAKLVEAQILPAAVGPERLEAYLRVGEATAVAFDSYRAEGRYPVPIALFRAREVTDEEDRLGSSPAIAGHDVALGWKPLAAGEPRVSWVDGDHVTMMTRPHVGTIGERLRSALSNRRDGNGN